MRKLLALLIILLLVGCYTTMPVHTMSDSQLQQEYLEKSSELASKESQLQNRRYMRSLDQSFQEGMENSLIYSISELRGRLIALRLEMSRRGLWGE